jgi:hypothetical protein
MQMKKHAPAVVTCSRLREQAAGCDLRMTLRFSTANPPKECYAVTETNVFQLSKPGTFADPLTEGCATSADV